MAKNSKLKGVGKPTPSAGFLRGEPTSAYSFGNMPTPQLRDRSEDVRSSWMQVNSRADDAIMNNGWIAGAVEQVVASMIGTGLRLNARPDMSAFGWDDKKTSNFASLIERRFETYCDNPYECDASARYSMGQLQAAAVRQWLATGEVLGQIVSIRRAGCETSTKVRLMPSHWLSQRSNAMDGIYHGVKLDVAGAPVGYVFNIKDANGQPKEVVAASRDSFGRPNVIHILDGSAQQVRGISIFASILKIVRQYDQLADATLTAAMIQTILAATIESDYPTAEVMQAMQDSAEAGAVSVDEGVGAFNAFLQQKVGWHKDLNIDLGRHGKIAHLLAGEKLKLNASEHPNSNYEAFANFLLREIATALGVVFEDVSGDYRGATYSSVRMGIAKKWPLLEYRRKHIPARFMRYVYEAWLEEEIDSGRIPLDGGIDAFVANRSAITTCDWRGPAKPQADDNKASSAHETWLKMGVMTQEMICNDLGVDYEHVKKQRARERSMDTELGLPDPILTLSGGAGPLGASKNNKTALEPELNAAP